MSLSRQPSIRSISLYGFAVLILGAVAVGALIAYLLFSYGAIVQKQRVVEDAYDSIMALKHQTERLLTTAELVRQKQVWAAAVDEFGLKLALLTEADPDSAQGIEASWGTIGSEVADIRRQLASPLFSDSNLMEKSLLRRLGEGLNSNESGEYYVAVRTLVNTIDFLQQRQDFLLDDLQTLNRNIKDDGALRLSRIKQLLFGVASIALLALLAFAAVIFRLTGRAERELLRIQGNLSEALAELEVRQQNLQAQRDTLDHLAHHDTLTGMPNRLMFLDHLRVAVKGARRRKESLALLFIDLDRFKEINDSLGHTVGDEVLKTLSRRFRRDSEREEVFARLGGDEFTVLIEAPESRQAIEQAADSIIARIAEPIHVGRQELYLTCSIGISLFPDDAKNAELLLRNADSAMYKAKDEGKNNYQFYTSEMTRSAYERVKLETNLRKALEQDEFELFYQPQVDMADGALLGFEALIRWRHKDFGLVSPASFIPIAEETGLIIPIGDWVLETAARQMADWYGRGFVPGRMAVNLAGKQITQGQVLAAVKRVIAESGCRPEWLELEVTEGLIMRNQDETADLLHELGALGIEIAIDDFGTGYSSLAYLKHLPITKLKIDQSFVRSIPGGTDDAEIVKAIIAMARGLNLDVLAEGVELQQQADFLLGAGCAKAQGYLYGRPMTARDAEALLARQGARPQRAAAGL
ncbi:MAG: EAL domain-containing protein [Rhodocyclales bacterium]|nr:EAL domain-containing protein [Rhodocyclales bacterium]